MSWIRRGVLPIGVGLGSRLSEQSRGWGDGSGLEFCISFSYECVDFFL